MQEVREQHTDASIYVLFLLSGFIDACNANYQKKHRYAPAFTHCMRSLVSRAQRDETWRQCVDSFEVLGAILNERSMIYGCRLGNQSIRGLVQCIAAAFFAQRCARAHGVVCDIPGNRVIALIEGPRSTGPMPQFMRHRFSLVWQWVLSTHFYDKIQLFACLYDVFCFQCVRVWS